MRSTLLAVLVLSLFSTAYGAEKPSQTFLKKAIEGNYAEVQMGQLAQQKGQSDDVKKFGQMLSDDHSGANQKAIDAAKSMGVTPPDGPNAKQKAEWKSDPCSRPRTSDGFPASETGRRTRTPERLHRACRNP
jgi:putative membrane protein